MPCSRWHRSRWHQQECHFSISQLGFPAGLCYLFVLSKAPFPRVWSFGGCIPNMMMSGELQWWCRQRWVEILTRTFEILFFLAFLYVMLRFFQKYANISNASIFFRGRAPQTKIEHILCAVSKLLTLYWNNNNNNMSILKQIVWETQKWPLKMLVSQAVLELVIKIILCTFWLIY